jgi:hypothetical protein
MSKGYVEAGWSEEEIREAVDLLRQGQTVYLFKGEYWDHRMLRHAVEAELAALEEKKQTREYATEEHKYGDPRKTD